MLGGPLISVLLVLQVWQRGDFLARVAERPTKGHRALWGIKYQSRGVAGRLEGRHDPQQKRQSRSLRERSRRRQSATTYDYAGSGVFAVLVAGWTDDLLH